MGKDMNYSLWNTFQSRHHSAHLLSLIRTSLNSCPFCHIFLEICNSLKDKVLVYHSAWSCATCVYTSAFTHERPWVNTHYFPSQCPARTFFTLKKTNDEHARLRGRSALKAGLLNKQCRGHRVNQYIRNLRYLCPRHIFTRNIQG